MIFIALFRHQLVTNYPIYSRPQVLRALDADELMRNALEPYQSNSIAASSLRIQSTSIRLTTRALGHIISFGVYLACFVTMKMLFTDAKHVYDDLPLGESSKHTECMHKRIGRRSTNNKARIAGSTDPTFLVVCF
jgi:hypothetical protein